MKRRQMVTGVGAALLTGTLPRRARAARVIKIGVIQSLSGPAAPFGIPQRDIIRLMMARINAEGGVAGRQIELVVHDDQTNPTEAARGAARLIRQEGVQAILGSSTTGSTLAMMPIAEGAKVPVMAGVSAVAVTAPTNSFAPWVFRMCTSSRQNVDALVTRLVFVPGHKKVALFVQEDAFGKEEAELATAQLQQRPGVEIVASASAPPNAIDLSAAATRLRNAAPEVVLMHTSAPAMGGAFVRAAREVGLDVPIGGTVSLGQRAFISACGPAGQGVKVVAAGNWDDPSTRQSELGALMRAGGLTPSGYGDLFGASSVLTLVEALNHVDGEPAGAKIQGALEGICGFQTYMDGRLCFARGSHDGYGPELLALTEIDNGRFKTLRQP